MKTENRRNSPVTGLTVALVATAFVATLSAQGAFAMVDQHNLETTEASESGVMIVSGAGPRGEAEYIRPDSDAESFGNGIDGPVGRLPGNPAE